MGPQTATGADPGIDMFRQHFAGRRGAERVPCVSEVLLLGEQGPVRGRALDLSDGGAQIEVLDESFLTAADAGGAADCFALLERHFRGPICTQFTGTSVEVESEIVRIAIGTDPGSKVRLGCRFRRPLAPEERVLLGLDAPPEEGPVYVPKRGAAVFLLLFQEGGATAGPLCAARVVSLEGRRIAARADGLPDSTWLAARLRSAPLSFALVRDGTSLWAGRSRSVKVDGQADWLGIEILAEDAPSKKALKAFRRV